MKISLQACVALGFLVQNVAAVQAADSTNVQILSATIRDQKIAGATVTVRKNGGPDLETTDAEGHAALANVIAADPDVSLVVSKEGYSDLEVQCPCLGMTYAISPNMDKLDGVRIVLNWGANPQDLDGHLTYPLNHVFRGHRNGEDAAQGIDHADGRGPETITIARKHPGERYVYAVHDFTDRLVAGTTGLSNSDAKVFVYVGRTLIRTYYVPKNRQGNIWRVFAISEEGEFQDINEMRDGTDDPESPAFIALVYGSSRAAVAPDSAPPVAAALATARKLNAEGEAAYQAGHYLQAYSSFQAAVALDNSYGQAYSNLGLVYQKSGQPAEALWVNRKAIALASGPNANTVRANTHFNNGRIYEDKEHWSDALREYRAAQEAKSNAVYANAIARVQQHGAQ